MAARDATTKTWDEIRHSCIAYPCIADRKKGSAFCAPHKKDHERSAWVKVFRREQ